jgi:hypothetical protein
MSSDKETKGIEATIIIEVIGRPPEHLTETLNDMIKNIDAEKGVSVTGKKLNEPVLMKDQKDFYVTFAEVDLEIDEIVQLFMISLKYMPANIEIVHPELIAMTKDRWNTLVNELLMKLHQYDEVARILQTEKLILEKKLKALTPKVEVTEDKEEKKD